jgi:adsorption protein B
MRTWCGRARACCPWTCACRSAFCPSAPGQRIARESEIAAGLRLLRGDAHAFKVHATPLLGDILLDKGLIESKVLATALEGYRPDQHGRIGDFLVRQGIVTLDAIHAAVGVQQRILTLSSADGVGAHA